MAIVILIIFIPLVILSVIWCAREVRKATLPLWKCKHCGYDLTGTSGPRCSECGRPSALRPRSTWWLLAPFAVLCLFLLLLIASLYYIGKWPSRLPTNVLIHLAPLDPSSEQREVAALHDELLTRVAKGVPVSHMDALANRIFHEMDQVVVTRSRWPYGVPIRIEIQKLSILAVGDFQFCVRFDHCDTAIDIPANIMALGRPDPTWRDSTLEVPDSCALKNELAGEIILSRTSLESGGKVQLSSRRFSVPIERVETIDAVMVPVDECLVADVFQDRFKASLRLVGSQAVVALTWHKLPPSDVAVAFRIIIECGDRVFANGYGILDESIRNGVPPMNQFIEIDCSSELVSQLKQTEHCVARLDGDAEMALRSFGKRKYWSGSFLIPLGE